VIGPVVLAHLEGDDTTGVALTACTCCGGILVHESTSCRRCEPLPVRARVLIVLRRTPTPLRPRDVARLAGIPVRVVRESLRALTLRCRPPRVTRVGNGRYGVAS